MVSKDAAKCLDAVHDRYASAACVPRMFPDVGSYAEDGWRDAFKQCLLTTADADMRGCASQIPPGMQDRMRKKMP